MLTARENAKVALDGKYKRENQNRMIFFSDTAERLPKRQSKVCKCDWVLNAKRFCAGVVGWGS